MNYWDQLQRALTVEVDLLGQAVELAERKRQTLVQNDVQALNELLPEEEALAERLQGMEFSLTSTIGTLAGQVGANSLGELLESSACAQRDQLEPLYQQMVIRLAGLQQANEQNRLLLEQAMAFVSFSLKLLTSSKDDPAYDSGGRSKQQAAARLVDRKL